MPSRFQVLMHASGFHIADDSGKPVVGFYTIRRTMAETAYQAGRKAVENLWKEPRTLDLLEATRENLGNTDSCKIEVNECFEVSWWDWMFKKCPGGRIYYPAEEDP
jgi:hypothetical protein